MKSPSAVVRAIAYLYGKFTNGVLSLRASRGHEVTTIPVVAIVSACLWVN